MSIKNLSTINNLQELSLDNNPLSIEKNYKRNVLAQLISLKKLDSKKVTVNYNHPSQIINQFFKITIICKG